MSGLAGAVALAYSFRDQTRIAVTVDHDIRYSFADLTPYYLSTAGRLTLTQRIHGPLDVQVVGGAERLEYEPARGSPARQRAATGCGRSAVESATASATTHASDSTSNTRNAPRLWRNGATRAAESSPLSLTGSDHARRCFRHSFCRSRKSPAPAALPVDATRATQQSAGLRRRLPGRPQHHPAGRGRISRGS